MSDKREPLKIELRNYQPTDEERQVMRSAMFRFITPMLLGAAALGYSTAVIGKSRKWRYSTIATFLGVNTGILCGAMLGADRGMNKLREGLPQDSKLLGMIHQLDELKKQ
ncbi:hypothetical protein CU097_009238 [Rhizopus azygosporus]|uniref:Uncharacterized protein n=2 Tax=Rhizopus TaxID=4842 RepID=A0A367JHH4_RHIAZ|nr:hypothetical protein BCV71DRAFT_178884 [Rhizopus microsporus]RCH89346.1 hypothetical protein CU097_009238 [Rhizopus azygosporus]CEG65729.1 hypothetical protein RMATCC62417_02449 [Rhizopus microsporus]CEJ03111.1 hypothetical protein RMCBS344292_17100 [Rhizopus microsporus]